MPGLLDSLRQIVNQQIVNQNSARELADADPEAVSRAAAVLLIELAMADDSASADERAVIEAAMREKFGLEQAQLETLMAEADSIQKQSTSLHDFTQQLRASMDAHARGELIEWLWRVAYADGRLDRYEEHMIRRLADLIGVPHQEMMRRKHRAAGPG